MNEITTTTAGPPAQLSTLAIDVTALTAAAANPATDAVKVKAIYDVMRQVRADAASEAFYADLAAMQGEMEPVIRNADNPQTKSKYAKFDKIQVNVKPIEKKFGFSITYDIKTVDDRVSVSARLGHHLGHFKDYGPVIEKRDMTGAKGTVNKTELHGFGSTVSYLKRYLVASIYNIPLIGEDDDGNAGGGMVRHHGDTNTNASPPRRQQTKTLPEPIARDPDSWLGKAEAWIDTADGENAYIKRHVQTAEKCPSLDDLNNLEDDFARSMAKAPPAVSTPIRAAWTAARKRLTPPADAAAKDVKPAEQSTPNNEPPDEFLLHDETGDVMGAYASAIEFAREFIDLWRVADDPPQLEAMNGDALAEARAADPEAVKVLAELGTLDEDDPVFVTIAVPMTNGKQDWVAYRKELRRGLTDATNVAAWFDAQRPTLSGASKAVQQMAAKELSALIKAPDAAPAWLTAWLPKAAPKAAPKANDNKPPVENDPRTPEEIRADAWIEQLRALTKDAASRKIFTEMVLTKGAECRETMIRWKANKNPLFDRVDPIVREKAELLGIAG